MSIPKNAKQVFSGIIFDVYQWPQTLYDGSTATFEMLSRPHSLQVLPTMGNKIILSHEIQPPMKHAKFTLLGGRPNTNETPLAGAKRELLEESGLVSRHWSKYKTFQPYDKIDWTVHLFLAKHCTKQQEPNPGPGEIVHTLPVSFNEFIDIATSDDFWCTEVSMMIFKMKKKNALKAFKDEIFG